MQIHEPNIIGPIELAGAPGSAGDVLTSAGVGAQAVWAPSGGFTPVITDFLVSGTYTLPVGGSTVEFIVQGGGGGGGGGARQASGVVTGGGGGGGGGNQTVVTYNYADIGGAGTGLTIIVGTQATGGPKAPADDFSGSNGTAGRLSSVARTSDLQLLALAKGGSFGAKGTTGPGGAGGVDTLAATYLGGNGGSTSVTGGAGGTSSAMAGGGGGGGAGIDTTDIDTNGGSGSYGAQAYVSEATSLPVGGTAGVSGQDGNAQPVGFLIAGGGGAGGGSGVSVAAGNGGNGAFYGGGGGGGGGSRNGLPAGNGGIGRPGFVRIIVR